MFSDGIFAVEQTQQTLDSSIFFEFVSYQTYTYLMEQTHIQLLLWKIVQYIM